MTTWQSKRGSKRRYAKGRRQPSRDALRAKRERADAARMALPQPIYPHARREGDSRGWIVFHIDGHETMVELYQGPAGHGRRPRSDSFQSRSGARILATGGLHAVCRQAIAKEVPRAMSRRLLSTLTR